MKNLETPGKTGRVGRYSNFKSGNFSVTGELSSFVQLITSY